MSRTRLTSTLTALSFAALLTGCGSTGIGDILGGGSGTGTNTDGDYSSSNVGDNVRGTVERVDTRDRFIVVNREDYSNNLRNGNEDEIVLYYDDRTVVQHQGRTYRPQDIEPGDRILADVGQSGGRLMVEEIEVLYDATSRTGSTGSTGSQGTGTYDNDDDNYDNDSYNDDARVSELRGTVRSIDTRDRTLEIETSRNGSSNFSTGGSNGGSIGNSTRIVEVYYDAQTIVEFEGRRYQPENLERGDLVEIEIRDNGDRLLAEEILVLGEGQSIGR